MRLTDEQIGAELRALRQAPEEGFSATLDQRVTSGFPAARRKSRERELTWGRLLPVLGALATVTAVVVVISNSGSGGGGTDTGFEATPSVAPSGGSGASNQARSATSTAESQGALGKTAVPPIAPAPPTGTRPRNGRAQVQERTAQLGLATDADKLQDAAGGVVDVADRYDGFVDSSNVQTGGSRGRASFSLRIPTIHLQDALSDLSGLGRVTLLNQGSTNITGAYVDANKDYADAREKVESIREQLRNAQSSSEADAIRAQLDAARQELATARAALRGLKQRVALTPVSVEITAQGDGSWSIGDAADDAVGVLEAIGGAALVTLAVLVPLALLLALGWLGTRELQRRQRESSLDG
jgi:uncharacterized protein DUF4349